MEVVYAQPLVKDMLSAISYLHANGIVHRDLKLENFIFSGPEAGEGKIKLIDFGLSRACLESEVMTADVGSVIYKAPEVMKANYSEASDLWSLGVICHMLVTGIVPWEGESRVEIEASINKEISDPAGFHGYLTWFYESMYACLLGVVTRTCCICLSSFSFLCRLLAPILARCPALHLSHGKCVCVCVCGVYVHADIRFTFYR